MTEQTSSTNSPREHITDGSPCWCNPIRIKVPALSSIQEDLLYEKTTEENEFEPSAYDRLSEIVGIAVGGGSVCWENMDNKGIFNDQLAKQIVDTALHDIREAYLLIPRSRVAAVGIMRPISEAMKEDNDGA